jgi:hypothetical protein
MGKKQSPTRAARRAAALAAKQQGEQLERALQAVPDPAPAPARAPKPRAAKPPEKPQLNFLLPPGGRMGGRLMPKRKSVNMDGPMNAHVLDFQAQYQGMRYKVQNASIALWRVLLEEIYQNRLAAEAEEARTGVPVVPEVGPFQRAFEEQLDRMDAEASGALFEEGA